MDPKEKVDSAKRLFAEAKAILENPESKAEDHARVEGLVAEAKTLQGQAMRLSEIVEATRTLETEAVREAAHPDNKVKGSGAFSGMGEFLYAAWEAKARGFVDPRLVIFPDDEPVQNSKQAQGRKDMSEQTGAGGGFLVPIEQRTDLMAVSAEMSIIRPRSTVIPMRRRQLNMPVLDQTDTTAGIPHWYGGLQFFWTEEGGEKATSDPSFKQVTLTAHKLVGFTRSTDELLDDEAVGLDAFLAGPMGMAGGVAWMEDFAFYQGDGVGKPLGFLNGGCVIVVPRVATGEIRYNDIVAMLAAFLPAGQGVWLISQSAMGQILKLNGPTGGTAAFIWLPAPANVAGPIPGTLFGYPVIWTEKAPVLGAQGAIALVDLRYYLIGDRQATTIEATKFEKWAFDKTSWRIVHRVDGQPWLSAPLTLQDGSTKVSPFVILDDATGG